MGLTEYLNESVGGIVSDALRAFASDAKEGAFLLKLALTQKKAATIRQKRESAGEHIPAFLIASVATRCNLQCAGCYARANRACGDEAARGELGAEEWDRIFREAAVLGISFVLLAGGEPMMRRDVLEKAAGHPELVFPIFTNGTLLDDGLLQLLEQHRNLIPVLSIEGDREETDRRRGRGTFDCLTAAMEELNRRGILYGASVTVTKRNLETVSGENFVRMLSGQGCKLVFYVEYVPADGRSELAPDDADRAVLGRNREALRSRFPNLMFFLFPGDEKRLGGCLAAGRGFFHINAFGGAEPCPFSPYSDVNLKDTSLGQALNSDLFRKIRETDALREGHGGGCALFERRDEVKALLTEN